jgi:hypothetical protein
MASSVVSELGTVIQFDLGLQVVRAFGVTVSVHIALRLEYARLLVYRIDQHLSGLITN